MEMIGGREWKGLRFIGLCGFFGLLQPLFLTNRTHIVSSYL
jgi:hypothetical protein